MVLIYRIAISFPERSSPEKTEKHLKTGRSFSGLFKKKESIGRINFDEIFIYKIKHIDDK